MTHHVPEFEVALAAADYKRIDDIWLALIEENPGEAGLFLALAKKLVERKEHRRAASLLGHVVEDLKSRGDFASAYEVLLAVIGYHPQERGLWEQLMELIPQVFEDFPEIDELIATGRDQHEGDVRHFLEYLDTYTHFRPGEYVNHAAGWGIGKVVSVSPSAGRLTVDFAGKAGHQFALAAAQRMITRLPTEHFDVAKLDRLDELRELCRTEPLEAVKLCLRWSRRKLAQRDLKTRFVPDVLDQKAWSRFLTKTKKAASQDPFLRVGTGANPMFELLDRAVAYEDMIRERYKRPLPWQEKLVIARNAILETETHHGDPTFLADLAPQWEEALQADAVDESYTEPEALGGALWLRDCQETFPALSLHEPPALSHWYTEPAAFLELIARLPVAHYQQRLLREAEAWAGPEWPALLFLAMLSPLPSLWDVAHDCANKTGHAELFDKLGGTVTASPETYPGPLLWYVRQYFLRADDSDAHVTERLRLFEKLLALGNRLQHRVDRGQRECKAWLTKLKSVLSEKRTDVLGVLIAHVSEDRLAQVLAGIERCRGLGDNLQSRLKGAIVRAYPEIALVEAGPAPAIDPNALFVTAAGLLKRQREYDRLMRDVLPDVQKAIGEALAMGDISENAELDAARERESQIKYQAAQMQDEFSRVALIEASDVTTDTVGLGTRVTYRNVETGKTSCYTILGPWDSDPERGIISYRAHIAEALLGHATGDTTVITTVRDQHTVEILSIEHGMEQEVSSATPDA